MGRALNAESPSEPMSSKEQDGPGTWMLGAERMRTAKDWSMYPSPTHDGEERKFLCQETLWVCHKRHGCISSGKTGTGADVRKVLAAVRWSA